MDILMVLMIYCLRADHVAAHAEYHAIGARVIRRVVVMAVTAAAQAGLTWSGSLIVVVRLMFGSVGCHAIMQQVKMRS